MTKLYYHYFHHYAIIISKNNCSTHKLKSNSSNKLIEIVSLIPATNLFSYFKLKIQTNNVIFLKKTNNVITFLIFVFI